MKIVDFRTALQGYVDGREAKMYLIDPESGVETLIPIRNFFKKLEDAQYVLEDCVPAQTREALAEDVEEPRQAPQAAKTPKEKPKRKVKSDYNCRIDVNKLMALYRAGWSVPKIADELACAVQTVRYHLNKEQRRNSAALNMGMDGEKEVRGGVDDIQEKPSHAEDEDNTKGEERS